MLLLLRVRTGIRYDNSTIENVHQHRSAGRRESDLGPDGQAGAAVCGYSSSRTERLDPRRPLAARRLDRRTQITWPTAIADGAGTSDGPERKAPAHPSHRCTPATRPTTVRANTTALLCIERLVGFLAPAHLNAGVATAAKRGGRAYSTASVGSQSVAVQRQQSIGH